MHLDLVILNHFIASIVCPKSCEEAFKQCMDDIDCNESLNNISKECKNVLSWDGNSTKPQCTDECKTMINHRKLFPKMEQMDCCMCDKDNCIKKRNVEILCDIKLDRSDECQNKMKVCEDIRATESNLDHKGIHRIVTDLSSPLRLTICYFYLVRCMPTQNL